MSTKNVVKTNKKTGEKVSNKKTDEKVSNKKTDEKVSNKKTDEEEVYFSCSECGLKNKIFECDFVKREIQYRSPCGGMCGDCAFEPEAKIDRLSTVDIQLHLKWLEHYFKCHKCEGVYLYDRASDMSDGTVINRLSDGEINYCDDDCMVVCAECEKVVPVDDTDPDPDCGKPGDYICKECIFNCRVCFMNRAKSQESDGLYEGVCSDCTRCPSCKAPMWDYICKCQL
jgi:hypothetical protein